MLANLDSLLLLWNSKQYIFPNEPTESAPYISSLTPEDYEQRLNRIPAIIEMPYNNVVQKFIDQYTGKLNKTVSFCLGAGNFYIPMFEEALNKYDVPLELKYLPVIESALNAKAKSPVGAMGLWQFMVGTGKIYGLEVNSMVDERRDSRKASDAAAETKSIPFLKCFTYRQTWSFIAGKFFTDGVWWFYLFWAPAYFSDQFGYKSSSGMGMALIVTLYAIVTVISIFGGYLPKYFVEKKNMHPYSGRMLAMLIFAFFPLFALFAQPMGQYSAWWPAIIIGLAGAGHQAWSASLFSTVGDMFPKSAIATITGIGGMAGGIGSFLINKGAGWLFTYSENAGAAFSFLGFEAKEAGYMIVFCICAVAYIIAWAVMKALVPKYSKIEE